MAHTRITDSDARIIDQCARGRFIRNVATASYTVAYTRSGNLTTSYVMADAITNESGLYKGIFAAPCDGELESIYFTGSPWPIMASGGYVQVQMYKNGLPILTGSGLIIGGHDISGFQNSLSGHFVALNSGVAYDGTINTASGYNTSLSNGQAIYSLLNVSNNILKSGTTPGFITVNVEWIPKDKTYAQA